MEDDLSPNEEQFIDPLEDQPELSLEDIKQQIAYQLVQLEPADMYLLCGQLLERWKHIPQSSILKVVEGGMLIPFRYADASFETSIVRCRLYTVYDEENGCETINTAMAEADGVMFSLANVLLLENKFPRIFLRRGRKAEKFDNPYDVIVSLMASKEELELQVASLRGQLEDAQEALTREMRESNSIRRYLDRLQSWLAEAQASNRGGSEAPPCDGQGFPRWLCDRRRKRIPDKDTVETLNKEFGFSQSVAVFMVATPTEFQKELDAAASGRHVTHEARRGTFRSITTGINRERRKKGQGEADGDPL